MAALVTRLRAVGGVAAAQLRHHRQGALLSALGVALAVVLVVSLVGLGHGALSTGSEAVTWFDEDLWATGGAVELAPASVGGVVNPIRDSHELSAELGAREDVDYAQPVAFQTVYVGTDPAELDTVIGVGVGGDAGRLRIASRFNRRDLHYADGRYDGPMTRRIIVDGRTAARYGLAEGDTLHVGATLQAARENEFRVVGITDDLSNFLGAPTVGMHLSELQEVSGTTGTDPATFIALTVAPGHDPERVATEIERTHPSLRVRTGSEQVRATARGRPGLAASALSLMGLAVVGAVVLVGNVLAQLAGQQRRQLAALKALGLSTRTLVGVVTLQGALLGLAGGVAGVVLSVPAVVLLNRGIERLVGYDGLVVQPLWLLAGTLCLAVLMGVAGASVAGWRVARLDPLDHLRP